MNRANKKPWELKSLQSYLREKIASHKEMANRLGMMDADAQARVEREQAFDLQRYLDANNFLVQSVIDTSKVLNLIRDELGAWHGKLDNGEDLGDVSLQIGDMLNWIDAVREAWGFSELEEEQELVTVYEDGLWPKGDQDEDKDKDSNKSADSE